MQPSVLKIDNKYVDYLGPIDIIINRGTEPSVITFLARDDDQGNHQWKSSRNPISIEITTAASNGSKDTLNLRRWYITSVYESSPGIKEIKLQDARWFINFKKFTGSYNLYHSGFGREEKIYEHSLNGTSEWTCYDAAKDVIKKMGLGFKDEQGYPKDLKKVILPRNLGNSDSGGFVGESFANIIPLMLEPIRSDLVLLSDGRATITDRSQDQISGIDDYILVEGAVRDRDIHWQKPKKCIVTFEQRVERRWEGDEGATSSRGRDLEIENVMPRLVLAGSAGTFRFLEQEGHINLLSNIQSEFGITQNQILERYLKPRIIIIDESDPIEDADEKDQHEAWTRECFRLKWRIRDDDSSHAIADIIPGHLGVDGTTRSERSVYMPYSFIYRYTNLYRGQSLNSVLNTTVSRNVPFDNTRPAPFLPVLFSDARGEVILQLVKQPQAFMRDVFPGETTESIEFGEALNISLDQFIIPTEHQIELKDNFSLHVYYHGILTDDRFDLGLERLHKEEVKMFSDGPIPQIEIHVRDITANHGVIDRNTYQLGLANADELKERAEDIAEQIRQTYADGKAGVLLTAGLEAITKGDYWVRGNIYQAQITIGGKKPYSVECLWNVLPEARPVYTDDFKKRFQGPPVRRIR